MPWLILSSILVRHLDNITSLIDALNMLILTADINERSKMASVCENKIQSRLKKLKMP